MKTKEEINRLKQAFKITDLLARMGIKPDHQVGIQLAYKSPLTNENSASFMVDDMKNVFNDFSSGQKGDVITLVMALRKCSFFDAIDELESTRATSLSFSGDYSAQENNKTEGNKPEIEFIRPFGSTSALKKYCIEERKISYSIAAKFLSEIYYKVGNGTKYYALGFNNDNGGYSIRNRYFKGCLGIQCYTYFSTNSKGNLLIFEGFFDYLSYLELFPNASPASSIILNSKENFKNAIPIIKNFDLIEYWGDSDRAGSKLLDNIREINHNVIDQRKIYSEYKDLNDYLKNSNNPLSKA